LDASTIGLCALDLGKPHWAHPSLCDEARALLDVELAPATLLVARREALEVLCLVGRA